MHIAAKLYRAIVQRELTQYPSALARVWYLALTITAALIINYHAFLAPAVLPLLRRDLGISLELYSLASIMALLLGALGSLAGSLSDRLGRANIIVYGAILSALLTFGLAGANSPLRFLIVSWLIIAVEGITLVATLALVRDFSPQTSRGVAIGVWSIGPWGGQVLANVVAGQTLPIFDSWQSQYVIAGSLSFVTAGICFVSLRELSPALRRQVVARPAEISSTASATTSSSIVSWPVMLRLLGPALVLSALGYSCFQITRFTTSGFLLAYLTGPLKIAQAQANGITSMLGLGFIIGELVFGYLSDRLQLHKPVVLCGSIAAIAALLAFLRTTPDTSSMLVMIILLGLSLAMAAVNVAWLAGYTETAEMLDASRMGTALATFQALTRLTLTVAAVGFTLIVGRAQDWSRWWWICVAGVVLFLPTIAALQGPWRQPNQSKPQ